MFWLLPIIVFNQLQKTGNDLTETLVTDNIANADSERNKKEIEYLKKELEARANVMTALDKKS